MNSAVNFRLARRWLWTLIVVAVLAMAGLYRSIQAQPGPGTGLVVAGSGLLLALSLAQAARIATRLTGPIRPPHRSAGGTGTLARRRRADTT